MASDEPANKRLERIREECDENACVPQWGDVYPVEDIRWLLGKVDELALMLRASHDAVNDAARRWREIGYAAGKADGWDEALNG